MIKGVSQEHSGLCGTWKNLVEAPRGTPTQPAHQLLVGTPGLGQLVLSLTTHLRGKKGFTPRSLEKLSKAGFFSRPSFLDMAIRCILGKVKCFFGVKTVLLTSLNLVLVKSENANAENEDLSLGQGGGNYAALEPSILLQGTEPRHLHGPTDISAQGPEEAGPLARV